MSNLKARDLAQRTFGCISFSMLFHAGLLFLVLLPPTSKHSKVITEVQEAQQEDKRQEPIEIETDSAQNLPVKTETESESAATPSNTAKSALTSMDSPQSPVAEKTTKAAKATAVARSPISPSNTKPNAQPQKTTSSASAPSEATPSATGEELTADSDPSSQNEPTTEAKEAEQKSIQTENDGETQLPITAASTTPAEAETASETATVANEEPSETAVIDRKNSESDTNRNSNETKETDEPVITTRPAAPVKSEASGPLQGEDVDSTDSHADSPKENSVSTSATATDKETSATGTRSNSPPSSESVSGGTIASGGKGPSPHGVPEGQVISAERRKPLGSIPQPKYPQRDRVMNKEGQVILIGHVRLDGLIDKVWVESSTGSPEMVKSSVEAFTKWRFEPGTEAYVRKGIQFSLKGNVETGYARLGESEEK